jgi:hypothetical protein
MSIVVQRFGRTEAVADPESSRGATMNRPDEKRPEAEPTREQAEGETASTESGTAPIDEDVAGSVNAALPDADE